MTIFNYPALGYHIWAIIFFRVKNNEIDKFSKKLGGNKNCILNTEIFGDYDFGASLIFKDEEELNKSIANLLHENKEMILDYQIIRPFFSEMYPLKLIDGKENKSYNLFEGTLKEISLKEDEKIILKLLEKDSRIKLIDIAKKLNISAVLALHKLNKLYKNKIILGSKIFFDIEKFNRFYSIIQININNFSLEIQEKLKKFAKSDKHVNSIILSLNKPNCMLQIFNTSQKELNEVVKKIKKLLQDETIKIEFMFPQQEKEINTLPFI